MKICISFFLLVFLAANLNICGAAIFIYQESNNKVNITNKLQEEANNRFIENFDKYKLIYASQDEFVELKRTYNEGLIELAGNIEIKFDRAFGFASKDYQVDFFLLKAIAKSLSNFNPEFSDNEQRIGLMGLKKEWADTQTQLLVDPEINIRIAAKKLQQLLIKFEYDLNLALSAYYLSPEAVFAELNNSGDYPRDRNCRIFFTKTLAFYKELREQAGASTSIQRKTRSDGRTLFFNKAQE